jgi:hypothetical protein
MSAGPTSSLSVQLKYPKFVHNGKKKFLTGSSPRSDDQLSVTISRMLSGEKSEPVQPAELIDCGRLPEAEPKESASKLDTDDKPNVPCEAESPTTESGKLVHESSIEMGGFTFNETFLLRNGCCSKSSYSARVL